MRQKRTILATEPRKVSRFNRVLAADANPYRPLRGHFPHRVSSPDPSAWDLDSPRHGAAFGSWVQHGSA